MITQIANNRGGRGNACARVRDRCVTMMMIMMTSRLAAIKTPTQTVATKASTNAPSGHRTPPHDSQDAHQIDGNDGHERRVCHAHADGDHRIQDVEVAHVVRVVFEHAISIDDEKSAHHEHNRERRDEKEHGKVVDLTNGDEEFLLESSDAQSGRVEERVVDEESVEGGARGEEARIEVDARGRAEYEDAREYGQADEQREGLVGESGRLNGKEHVEFGLDEFGATHRDREHAHEIGRERDGHETAQNYAERAVIIARLLIVFVDN